jgi:hypothetical protein
MKVFDVIKERVKERTSICNECPHLKKALRQCNLCGCFVVPKAAIPTSTCPDGRWDK